MKDNKQRQPGEKWGCYSASLYVCGIAPRCRKADRHSIELGEYEISCNDYQAKEDLKKELSKKAQEKLAKFKQVQKSSIKCYWQECECFGIGISKQIEPFGSKNFEFLV